MMRELVPGSLIGTSVTPPGQAFSCLPVLFEARGSDLALSFNVISTAASLAAVRVILKWLGRYGTAKPWLRFSTWQN
jgi:hypothetical protein